MLVFYIKRNVFLRNVYQVKIHFVDEQQPKIQTEEYKFSRRNEFLTNQNFTSKFNGVGACYIIRY